MEQAQPCDEDLSVLVDEYLQAATVDAASKDHPTSPANEGIEREAGWDQLVLSMEIQVLRPPLAQSSFPQLDSLASHMDCCWGLGWSERGDRRNQQLKCTRHASLLHGSIKKVDLTPMTHLLATTILQRSILDLAQIL